jgi:hypothetical protein
MVYFFKETCISWWNMNGCSTCGGRGAAGARPRARAGGSTCNGSLNFALIFLGDLIIYVTYVTSKEAHSHTHTNQNRDHKLLKIRALQD